MEQGLANILRQYFNGMRNISYTGHLATFSANAIWGLMAPIAKIVLAGGLVTPLAMTNLRIAGAMLLFWLASLFQPREHVCPKDLLYLLGAALLAVVFNQGTFIFGLQLTTPGNASIITTSMPLWAMLLSALILKEPVTGKKVLGIAAGALGAILLILGSHPAGSQTNASHAIIGDILVLLAQLSYAAYLVIYKNFVGKYSLLTIMKWMFTWSFICVIPFSAPHLLDIPWSSLTLPQMGGVAYVIICGTFLSYLLIVIGQKDLRPTVASMYNYIQPVMSCLVALCLGLDSFNMIKGMAVLLIFSGVYLVTISKSREELEK